MISKNHGELFQRRKTNPTLTFEDLPYQAHSVFNPAATIVNDITLLLVRVEDHRSFSHFTVARESEWNWQLGDWQQTNLCSRSYKLPWIDTWNWRCTYNLHWWDRKMGRSIYSLFGFGSSTISCLYRRFL